jgi:hypothetical protein
MLDDVGCSTLLPIVNPRFPVLQPHTFPSHPQRRHLRAFACLEPQFLVCAAPPLARLSHWNIMLLFPPPFYKLRLQPLVFPLHWYLARMSNLL